MGTRGVHFRPGQPVRGLAGVQWDTARSGLDGRRNPGRAVRRQTGLRAYGGFAQGRRAQDWAGSLEDREDPGLRDNFRSSAACEGPWDQHGSSTRCSRVAAVRTRAKKAPLAYSPPVSLRYISALTCQYSFCRRDVALRSTIREGPLGRATHGPDVRRLPPRTGRRRADTAALRGGQAMTRPARPIPPSWCCRCGQHMGGC